MSLVQFLGIYFVHRAGIDVTTVGLAFLCENAARGLAAPLFGALSDRLGRRPLLIASSLVTALVLPAFLLVHDPLALLAWSLLLAAGEEGLGGVMTTVAIRREAEVKGLLHVPDELVVAAVIVVGRPVRQPRKLTRRPVEEFASVDRFDGRPFTAS